MTNGLTYLPQVDRIVVLKDNTISETGSYEELLQKDGAFAEFLTQYLVQTDMDEDNAERENNFSIASLSLWAHSIKRK